MASHRKKAPSRTARKKIVVLFSGGLDSTVTLAMARSKGHECHALTFAYGQRHEVEVRSARAGAKLLGAASHHFVELPFPGQASALTSRSKRVPKNRSIKSMSREIPVTYVPARNTVFLAMALAWAETLGASEIHIGANALDYSGYPDCRPVFIKAFERVARLGTRAGTQGKPIRIKAPLLRLTKSQIVAKGLALSVDFSKTHSCYDPDSRGRPCGRCDSCRLRLKGFEQAGHEDPLPYRHRPRNL